MARKKKQDTPAETPVKSNSVTKMYSYDKVMGGYEECRNERSEWETEWRMVSEYLLPGRGIYQTYSKPRKRKLTSPKVINDVGGDSLYVLTSGLHGGLTSPARPWFDLSWADASLNKVEPLKMWLQQCNNLVHAGLQASNFYSVINSFYIEFCGFGTGSVYVGSDTDSDLVPFRFELLTAGEYAFATSYTGLTEVYYRSIFKTPREIHEMFPDTCSEEVKRIVKENGAGIDKTYITIVEAIYPHEFQDKKLIRMFYEVTGVGDTTNNAPSSVSKNPLSVSYFYEMPYLVGRWGTIGSDTYGIGPGSRALPDIKRLQEMEKAFLMATHKNINPPLNAPSRMKNKLNTLPGGYNYYANPNEVITPIYGVNFDYVGVGQATERVENRIQRNFFNDIFLTGSRDPNATPYKATEVQAREQEKMLRLGPVIERLQHEFFQPLVERCFNIMLRKGLLPPLEPEYAEMAKEYKINLTSPLAAAQKSVALQGINSFLAFVGQAAQYDPTVMDNVNVDEATREYADISGVDIGVLRSQEEVQMIRKQRADAQAAEQAKQEAMQAATMQVQGENVSADTRKTASEASLNQLEGQQLMDDMGMM